MADYVSRVNKYCQQSGLPLPKYTYTQDDDLVWTCTLQGESATALSKKKAKVRVAQIWIQKLRGETPKKKNIDELARILCDDPNLNDLCFSDCLKIAEISLSYFNK